MSPGFFVVVLALAVGLGIVFWQQQLIIRRLRQSRDQIEGEESRAFDFLHRLGTELQENVTAANMHRFIVEGITQVLESEGAALYLIDPERSVLVPAYISRDCPAIVALPPESETAGDSPTQAILNFQRLQTLELDHALYGRVLARHHPLIVQNLSQHPDFANLASSWHEGVKLLACPLIYAGSTLGLLVVARKSWDPAFTDHEASVCFSLAQQSAFALGSARIHRDALGKRLLEAEIRTASEFQRILLPNAAPKLSSFDIAAVNYPARIVSGDYFDYVPVNESHLGIAIADVSGKGVPASLIMATCRSVLRAKASGELSPSDVLKVVNRQIFPDIREDMFITMAYFILDGDSDNVRLARAGHNPPLLFHHETRAIESLESVGMAVGIDAGGVFDRILHDLELQFHPGDILLLYTDGITEALSKRGEEFGEDGLRGSLEKHTHLNAHDLVAALFADLQAFTGTRTQSDDITLIAIKKG